MACYNEEKRPLFFSYLILRSGVFYFRRSVPRELRTILPRTEIWQSLRTKERQRAELLARDLIAKTDKLFFMARLSMTDQELQTAMRRYLHDLLGGFERYRDTGATLAEVAQHSPMDAFTWNHDFLALEDGFPLDGPITEAGLSKLINHYELKIRYLSDCLRLRSFNDDALHVQAERLISEYHLNVIAPMQRYDENRDECVSDPPSPDYQRLFRKLLQTQIEAHKVEIARLRGDYGNPYDRALERLLEPQTNTPVPNSDTASPSPTMSPVLLSEAIYSYMKDQRSNKSLKEVTFLEYEDACTLLTRIVGDKPVTDLTREDVIKYRDITKKLPPNINKMPSTREKTIEEILTLAQINGWKTLSEAAVGKKFEQLKAFVRWASSGGIRLIPYNVSEGVALPKLNRGPARDEKKPYTPQDIAGLARGLVEEQRKGPFAKRPERYWVPLIGLFSGMRQEEICQLYAKDIRHTDNVWCFDVDWLDDEDKPVKNLKSQNAKRLVPIHPILIDLGFLDYVSALKAKKQSRLWPRLKQDSRGKFSRNLKDWYNGGSNRVGFENLYIDRDPKKSFHSLRHTFSNALKQARADMIVTSEIMGHKIPNLAFDRYADEFRAGIKLNTIELVNYDFDFVKALGRWSPSEEAI